MAENIEKKTEKKKIRFNVIDIIIIVAVLACIGGVVLRIVLANNLKEVKPDMDEFILTFKAEELTTSQYDAVSGAYNETSDSGKFVSFADGGARIGTLYNPIESKILYITSYDGSKIPVDQEKDAGTIEKDIDIDGKTEHKVFYTIKDTIVCSREEAEQYKLAHDSTIDIDDLIHYMKGTIICKGKYVDGEGFLLNGEIFLSPNQSVEVTTKYAQFRLTVISIEPNK